MCQSNVYLKEEGSTTLVMEDVACIRVADEHVTLETIMGEEKTVCARICEVNLVGHRVLLEPEHHRPRDLADLIPRATAFHGHLGPFLVIGLRMGLLAKRHLGFDGHFDVKVKAFTGTEPPISCVVDGLQVATGASLGKGNIEVAQMRGDQPSARIEAGGGSLEIALTPHGFGLAKQTKGRPAATEAAHRVADLSEEDLFVVTALTAVVSPMVTLSAEPE